MSSTACRRTCSHPVRDEAATRRRHRPPRLHQRWLQLLLAHAEAASVLALLLRAFGCPWRAAHTLASASASRGPRRRPWTCRGWCSTSTALGHGVAELEHGAVLQSSGITS
ncbi:Os01g0670500 [Oryza sativa Japonica Group]|uniref:Os01g0670500 protein n=1 Tax=Oryza sativa subsp. japonica TaxID=39947 RepID=Q0JKJ1_ORYSJ|nr:Os01g0670500 [Oryza sativa Japonica Group]|eukprot:NP_001043823.1 Os01g0670500 [Oryza sativa Japonica Group]